MSASTDQYPPTNDAWDVDPFTGERHRSNGSIVFRPGTRSYYERMRTRAQAEVDAANYFLAQLDAQAGVPPSP